MQATVIEPQIAAFCQRWKIRRCSLFGSVLRDDFGPDSDIDVLVAFAPEADWDLWDLITAREELQEIFGREVDLVEEQTLKNPFRRQAILASRQVIYDADRT
jgi:predicted nucleotidyltransferase